MRLKRWVEKTIILHQWKTICTSQLSAEKKEVKNGSMASVNIVCDMLYKLGLCTAVHYDYCKSMLILKD